MRIRAAAAARKRVVVGLRRYVPHVLLLFATAGSGSAQEQRSALEGVVRDAQRAAIPGATIDARNSAGAGAWTAVTAEDGSYRFASLPPGSYILTATLQGFEPQNITVPLSLGETKRVDLTLLLAAVAEHIDVVAESPVVDVTNSAAYQTIRNELVDKLPRGRDFTSLVTFAPGANPEPKLAGISIDGASGAENQFVIDGLTTTDLRTGVSGKTLLPDFVEEVQVKSSGYASEFGGSTGGVVNVITRSGANLWTGTFVLYYGADQLTGPARPTLRLNPTDDTQAEYVTYPKDRFDRWEPGFTLGGPLKRDRLWLFAGYIPTLIETRRAIVFTGETEAQDFAQRSRTHNASVNVQAQVSQRLRARAAMNLSGTGTDGTLPPQDGTGNPLGPYDTTTDAPNAGWSANADHMASPSLLLATRVGYFRTDNRNSGVPDEIRYVNARSSVGLPGVPLNLQQPLGFATIPTNIQINRDTYSRLIANADASWYRQAWGRHTFKAGVQFERYANTVEAGAQEPNVRIFWNTPRRTLDGRVVRGPYGYYVVSQARTTGDISSQTLGLFIQDSWSIGRLTVNGGLRTEHEWVPSYTTKDGIPSTAIDFGFGDKLAPRLGFAVDLAGDGRWKAYGSWGVFYDVVKLELPRNAFGGFKLAGEYFTLDTPDWPSLKGPSPLEQPGGWPGESIERFVLVNPLNDTIANRIEPNLKPFEQRELTFGLEHAISARTSVSARYVHKNVIRAIEDVSVVDPAVGETFYLANPGFGIAKTLLPTACGGGPCPDQPPTKRQYDGLELRLRRRLADHWSVNASYLFSRLYGDYSGLASSDEEGRASPNLTRYGDGLYQSYDSHGRLTRGRLATDRPHQLKLQGIVDFDFGTTVGASWTARSGTPLSSEWSQKGIPFYAYGRGDLGRTPAASQLDLYVQHEFRLTSRSRLQLNINILNVFDQDVETGVFFNPYRETLVLPDEEFFAGFDARAAAAGLQPDARFGLANANQPPRAVVLGMKVIF